MTDHAPIDQPIVEILNAYNPLEIKDILLHGSWRKATHHKDWDDVLAYYQEYDSYIHHYLLDSPDAWNHYGMMQKAYSMTCLLYTSPSPRDSNLSRMPSSA